MMTLLLLGFGAIAVVAIFLPFVRQAYGAPRSEDRTVARDERDAAALAELRDLEFDRRLGKLAEEDYRELRTQIARRAVAELKALDEARATEAQRDRELDDLIERAVAARRRARRQPATNGQRTCPACGQLAGPADRFCAGCGAALPHACPECQAALPADVHFCPQCGRPLPAPVATPFSASDESSAVPPLAPGIPPGLSASLKRSEGSDAQQQHFVVDQEAPQDATPVHEVAPASALSTQHSGALPPEWGVSTPFPKWLLAAGIAVMLWAGVAGVLYFRARAAIASQRPIATIIAADYHTLAILPADPNVVFAGYRGGLLLSRDGGATWQPAGVSGDAMALAVHPAAPQRVYLAGHNLFLRSDDGGRTWEDVATGLPGRDIHAVAVALDNPETLYAFIVEQGLWRSTNAGASWAPVDASLAENVTALAVAAGTIYVGTADAGVLATRDGGATWTSANGFVNGALDSPRVRALAYDPATRTLYAGTDRGLSFMTAMAAGWTRRPFTGDVTGLALGPDGTTMLLVTSRGTVFRSRDRGVTWSGQ